MGDLGSQYLTPSAISYEPQMNSRTEQGERTGSGALREGETDEGITAIDVEAQEGGRNGWMRASEMRRRPG